jgi:hypothetical protein
VVKSEEGNYMRKRFIVKGALSETKLREALDPIIMGIDRTTHKTIYKTSKGIVEYVSIPIGSKPGRYASVGVSDTLRKIFLWHRESTDELEEILRSSTINIVEIVKDGPLTLELKEK